MLLPNLQLKIPSNRIFGLDIVRASAILFVMVGHGNQILPHHVSKLIRPFILDGVTIFFVLSGFLIGRILIKNLETKGNKMSSLVTFWKRRWYRTLPNYFLVLFFLSSLLFLFSPTFTFKDVALHFVFLQNLNWAPPWFFPEAWSISVEEWFYLAVPLFLFMLTRIPGLSVKNASLTCILFTLALSILLRLEYIHSNEIYNEFAWGESVKKVVTMRLDSIMFGMLGAYFSFYHSFRWSQNKPRVFVIGILLLIISQYLNLYCEAMLYRYVFSFSLVSFSVLLVLPFMSSYHIQEGFVYEMISKISLISYSLYLLHLTLVKEHVLLALNMLIISKLGWIGIYLNYILFWIISIIASTLLYKYWELPMMNLRDRKFKSLRP